MGENRYLFIEHHFWSLFNTGYRQVWVGMNFRHVGIDIKFVKDLSNHKAFGNIIKVSMESCLLNLCTN